MAAPGRTHVAAEEQPIHQPVEALSSGFRLGGIHRRAAHDLAHLARLLGQRAHLVLHIFAVQPHDVGQILGVEQLLGMVQRGRHVLLGVGDRLGADVLGAGANGGALALDLGSGLLRAGEKTLDALRA
jgi:hypothetical protein